MGLKATIRTPSILNAEISSPNGLSASIKQFAGGAGGKQQIYIGPDEPIDENILIWIDTSGETPVTITQLLTSDNKEFITLDNKNFILKEDA